MHYVINTETGALTPADTEMAAKMLCLRGHRPLTAEELAEVNGDVPAAEKVETVTVGQPTPPPKTGAGSGKAEWHTYAAAMNVAVAADASRDDVIAALTEAGVRTE